MAAAIDAGAEDVVQDGDEFQVLTEPSDFAAVRDALTAAGIEFENADLTMIPKTTVKLEENDARKTMKSWTRWKTATTSRRSTQLRHLRGRPRSPGGLTA